VPASPSQRHARGAGRNSRGDGPGGLASAKAKLGDTPLDLSTPQAQQIALERVVGSALNGKLNARAAQAIVSAISVSQRLYETIVLESRIKALEAGR
jgi:hypothetical protein